MFAKVKHIPLSGTHLGIVTAVNDLSREVTARRISLDEAIEKLKEIEKMPPKRDISVFLRREWEAEDFVIFFRQVYLKVWWRLLSVCFYILLLRLRKNIQCQKSLSILWGQDL